MTAKTPLFEHKSCSRCGGSGHYSYNAMDGTTCYGCRGRGCQYTKRGAAANAYFENLLSVSTDQLQIGQSVRVLGVTLSGQPYTAWERVVEIVSPEQPDQRRGTSYIVKDGVRTLVSDKYWLVITADKRGEQMTHQGNLTTWRILPTQEQLDAARADALAYQNTLTKTGTPRKNQQKSAA